MSKVTNHENMRRWIHMHLSKLNGSGEGEGGSDSSSSSLLMSLIPDAAPKPDLFLYLRDIESNPIDVTNYKIDDFINLGKQEGRDLTIECLYESSNLGAPIIDTITFGIDGHIFFNISSIFNGSIATDEVSYNNKIYYFYYQEET